MVEIGVDDVGAAVPEIKGCGFLPLMAEPVNVDQFGCVVPVTGQKRERSACVHGLQLRIVANEQYLRARLFGKSCDAIQGMSPGEARFVNDHELTSRKRRAVGEVVVPPLRSVLCSDTEIFSENFCGDS